MRHPLSFHVAGVVLGQIDFHFAWQAWHVWHRAGSGGALGSQVSPWAPRLFAWQAWHLGTCSCTLRGSSCTLRGRRGTLRHPPSFHVAGVVWRSTWIHRLPLCVAGRARMASGWLRRRAWFSGVAVGAAAFCMAGVALGEMELHFAWQAWHFAWQAWHFETSTFVSRGRRGTWTHRLPLCVAAKLKCQKCHMSCTHMSRTQTAMMPDHINKASTLHMTLPEALTRRAKK